MSKYDVFAGLMEENRWDEFRSFVQFNFLNHSYSVFNSALILLQKRGATIVKSESQWNKSGRSIKPGTSPIIILQPRGPVTLVYDYSDTYGENDYNKTTENLSDSFENRHKHFIDDECYSRFLEKLNHCGIIYQERSFGERVYGIASALEIPQKTYYTKKNRHRETITVSVSAYHVITVNSILNVHDKALTLFHELAHIYCGHIDGGKRTEYNKLPEYRGNYVDCNTQEYEAEMVCKILCERNSIADDCEEYLKEHIINGTVPPFNKAVVFSAVDRIRAILHIF